MTEQKQPEALRLAQFCRAIARGLRVRPYIEDLNAAAALLAHQNTEITELRAKLDELENQGPMSITGAQVLDALDELDASARGDEPYNHFAAPLIRGYVESTIAAGAQAKRDRKAAKRLADADRARRLVVTMRSI